MTPPRHPRTLHERLDLMVLIALTGAGALYPQPKIWFGSLLFAFACLGGSVLLGAGVVTLLATRVGERIQGLRARPAPIAAEAFETTRAMYVAACLMAWPLSQWRLGSPTGLRWTVHGPGELAWICLQTLLGVMALDAWLYWKHRLLHTRWLFGFHKGHHVFRDPTPFAGFAVAPVEALLTFWPILLVCIPAATHYAPLYFSLVVAFVSLNFYLHCGVTLRPVERTLPRVFLNTSAFHNVHHSRANTHFGEALILWDILCRTRKDDPVRASIAQEEPTAGAQPPRRLPASEAA